MYPEKLYGKNLLILVSPEGPLWLSLMGRTFCNFAYFRLLENAISNQIKLLREVPKQAHLRIKNVF